MTTMLGDGDDAEGHVVDCHALQAAVVDLSFFHCLLFAVIFPFSFLYFDMKKGCLLEFFHFLS